jgi:hypothetical protein
VLASIKWSRLSHAVIAGQKRVGNDDSPRIVEETGKYIRDFERLAMIYEDEWQLVAEPFRKGTELTESYSESSVWFWKVANRGESGDRVGGHRIVSGDVSRSTAAIRF